MKRDLAKLESEEYDLLVIGGGVHGAGIAWDAALRGLKVALVERKDFGGQTSSGCYKIIHGGLRYLQHLDLKRVCESWKEQRTLRKIAPHLVHPLPFLVPTYRSLMRSKLMLTLGLFIYDFLSSGRNKGLENSHHLPKFSLHSKEEALNIAPGLDPEGLSGAATYYDCQLSNCERMTLAVVQSAVAAGADVANYLEVAEFESEDGELKAAYCRDLTSGRRVVIKAKSFVNAAGPWLEQVAGMVGEELLETRGVYSKGFQVVVPRFLDADTAVAIESNSCDTSAVISRGGRSFFVTPWRGFNLIGTSDSVFEGDPDDFTIGSQEVVEFVESFNEAYAGAKITADSVLYAWGGLRPIDPKLLGSGKIGDATVAKEVAITEHWKERSQLSNLISVQGVKYTTFRKVAEDICNRLVRQFFSDRELKSCATEETLLAGASEVSVADERLALNYGSFADEIVKLVTENSDLGSRLTSDTELLKAELVYVCRNEMVEHLTDVVMRRTDLGTVGNPGAAVVSKAAAIVGSELGWSAERANQEIQSALQVFEA